MRWAVILALVLSTMLEGIASAQAVSTTTTISDNSRRTATAKATPNYNKLTVEKNGGILPGDAQVGAPATRNRPIKPLPKYVITRYQFQTGPDGAGCLGTVTTRRDTPITEGETALNNEVWLFANRLRLPRCPDEDGATRELTPAQVAEPFVRTIPMPVPRPRIPPGHAITGLPAYLETRGTLSHRVGPEPTELGPIEVHATGAYYVDWGDGSQPLGHDRQGVGLALTSGLPPCGQRFS